MKFATLLQKKHILIDQDIRDIPELFRVAAEALADGTTLEPHEIESAIKYRESLGSTYIGNGTMIPHAHLDKINDCIVSYIRPRTPLTLANGETVEHVFTFISSHDFAAFHLKIMKTISEMTKGYLSKLKNVNSAEHFIGALDKENILIESHLKAADFMQEIAAVYETDLLSKAIDLMKEQNWSHLPVVDNKGKYLGTVDFLDILATSIPDYALRISDLSFLSDFEPIKQFLQKENSIKIKPYIKNISTMIVPEDASYVEVFFLMVKHKHRFLVSVDNNNNFKGVIRSVDVISRILRA